MVDRQLILFVPNAQRQQERHHPSTSTTADSCCRHKNGGTYSLGSGASLLVPRRSLSLPGPAPPREPRSLLRLRSRVVDERCECRSRSSSRRRSLLRLSSASSSSRKADRQSLGFSFLDSLTDAVGSASPYGSPSSGSTDRTRLEPAEVDIRGRGGEGGQGGRRATGEVGRGGGGARGGEGNKRVRKQV